LNLHEYTVIGHNRSEIGRWLGVASLILSPLLASALGSLIVNNSINIPDGMKGNLASLTVSAALVYLCLYWIFNRYGWRWLDRLLSIPNLSGQWLVTGETLNSDGTTKYDWKARVTITQYWDRIAIELRANQSSSYSDTASLLVKPDGEFKLSYSYQNHPQQGEAQLQKHQGFSELIFNANKKEATGHYFNSLGRYTFGRMKLIKHETETK
jgi:hypothetical protein